MTNQHHNGNLHINETFNLMTEGDRIHSACFFDGNEGQIIVQFYRLSGSIARASYNSHGGGVRVTFVPVASWEYAELVKMHEAETLCGAI